MTKWRLRNLHQIKISDETDRYIHSHGKFGESYDETLQRLFKQLDQLTVKAK